MRMFHAVAIAAALACFGLAAQPLFADDYPSRPITDIVASTPGGGTDIVSRIFGEQLSKQLGQPFVVENIAGAGSLNGTVAAARATADGYTLQTGLNASMAVNPSLFAHLPYDPVDDFEPVGMLAEFPFAVVVSNNFPARSIKELIALAKKDPGKISIAVTGVGRLTHLTGLVFQDRAGVSLLPVPYNGGPAAALADVAGGRVSMIIEGYSGIVGSVKAGQVKLIAVASRERLPQFPDLPTVAETIPDFSATGWQVLVAPLGTPAPITSASRVPSEGRNASRRLAESDTAARMIF